MTTLELITPTGTIYSLSDGNPFALMDMELGMASVRRITDRGPYQHGDSDIDFRLDPLSFPIGLLIYASSISEHFDNRALALSLFRPSASTLRIRWTLDNADVRQLDCHVSGRLAFASKDMDGVVQRCVVPLRAADPTYYDPVQKAATFGVGGGGGAWNIPWVIPWSIGAAAVDQTRAIAYAGTWRTYPTVLITGPITSPVITNETTGDKLDFTGVTISAGDTYTVDCRAGVKTVMDVALVNKIADLSDDSDLATFSLDADTEAPGGVNSVRVTGSGATAATEIYLQYYERYIGI